MTPSSVTLMSSGTCGGVTSSTLEENETVSFAGAAADDSALADATVNIVSNTIEQSCSVITNFDRYLFIDIFLLRLEIHFGKRPAWQTAFSSRAAWFLRPAAEPCNHQAQVNSCGPKPYTLSNCSNPSSMRRLG